MYVCEREYKSVCVRKRKRTMGINSFYQINSSRVFPGFLKICGRTLGKYMKTFFEKSVIETEKFTDKISL